MKKTVLFRLISVVALFFIIYAQATTQTPYQKWVWFIWYTNYFSSIAFVSYFAISAFYEKKPTEYKTIFRYLFLIIPVTIGHLIIGALLSFFAQMEPLDFFGPNGYINYFESRLFFEKLGVFPSAYWLYLTSKLYLFKAKPSQKFSSLTYLADPILLFIGSVTLPLLALTWGIDVKQPTILALIGGCLMVLIFIPWRLFFENDVGSLIDDQEAHVKPNQTVFPMAIHVKGAKGWGLLFSLFGLIFIIVSLAVIKFSMQAFARGQYGSSVGLIFAMIFFMLIRLLFFSVGLNLNWAFKKYQIDSQTIYFEQKIYLPWPKLKNWSLPRHQFLAPEKVVRRVRQSEGMNYNAYQIIMRRKPEFKRSSGHHLLSKIFSSDEVLLYEAYFEKNFDETHQILKKLIG